MKLSTHFTLNEFTRSQTAIRRGIDNTPPPEITANLMELCELLLEPVRKHFGRPVLISSGYRCPALNRALGSSNESQHMIGHAADFVVLGLDHKMVADTIIRLELPFDQLILEFGQWVHISWSANPRGECYTAYRDPATERVCYAKGIRDIEDLEGGA